MQLSPTVTILHAYANWLDREIEIADKALKGFDLEREVTKTYIGPKNHWGDPKTSEDKDNLKNWEEIETTATALDGLRRIVRAMEEAVEQLTSSDE